MDNLPAFLKWYVFYMTFGHTIFYYKVEYNISYKYNCVTLETK